ncbi:MAG: threonine ammonia-lyase [Candidatus Korarchaeum sp.]
MNSRDLADDIFSRIEEAREFLRPVVHRTPLITSRTLSELSGREVHLKMENLQKTGSFKVRGAYYKMRRMGSPRGVVAASSGNHAQGVAYSAGLLGIKAVIVMPKYTPFFKVNATKGYGARVILHGETYDDAYIKAKEISESEGIPFIHPFDDPDVIAGQGTVGMEVQEDLGDADSVIVPVGGGGLISGIAIAMKSLNPNVRIIGVQPSGAPSAFLSYERGTPVETQQAYSIADGVVVKRPGDLTLRIMRDFVDEIVLVDDREIARAIFLLLERVKTVVEGAGALPVAALISGKLKLRGRRVVCVLSGGNIDPSMLIRITNRVLALEGRQVKVTGTLPDRSGQLKRVIDVVAELGFNIVEVEHERLNPLVHPGMVQVTLVLEVPERGAADLLISKLRRMGLEFSQVMP